MNVLTDNANYYNDPRVCDAAMAPIVMIVDEDGFDIEETLPTIWVVCPVCDGKGTHVNPSIDAGGLTAEDFAEDPDFAEDYLNGIYDQTCNLCLGRTTIQEVDEGKCDPLLLIEYHQKLADEAMDRSAVMAELSMGA